GKMHIKNLLTMPQANVVSVASIELDIPWLNSHQINDYAQTTDVVFKNPKIDAVVVAVPTPLHIEMIEQAVAHKKHIFCEKPVSTDPLAIKKISRLVKEAGLKIQ